MSTTTQKYGKPTFTATIGVDATVEASDRVKWGWKKLDEYTKKEYGSKGIHKYDHLSDKQKTELHTNINLGKYDGKD